MPRKIWQIKESFPEAPVLSAKYGISSLLAQIMISRDIAEADFASFLNPNIEDLPSPRLLPDMDKAAARIKKAVRDGEGVLVVGDYDVDGITSLAIFNEFIKEAAASNFSFYIPHRVKEGYGLNQEAVARARSEGRTLIVCFDCGTSSFAEIEQAKSWGIDVVVVDHHHCGDRLGPAAALVNPKRKDSNYPFCDLSAGALSFRLLQALKERSCWEVLDLVALSLVCDVVPLKGENRILLGQGLKCIRQTPRPAIKALCRVSSLQQENIDTFHLGFILGPRINAAGRVAHAQDSLKVFLSEDKEEVYHFASKLGQYNRRRKDIEAGILREAQDKLARDFTDPAAIVVAGDDWHPGVLGIVASRLVERYYRPCFVISFEDNVGRGSGRSIHSVHLIEALDRCCEELTLYGGHRKAAGIKLFKGQLDAFREKLNCFIKDNFTPRDFIPLLEVDAKIDFTDITMEFLDELDRLKPFGEENARPLFTTGGVSKRKPAKRDRRGYSFWLTDQERTYEGIVYDKDLLQILEYGSKFDIAYTLERNTYHNLPRLTIKDCKLAGDKS